MDLKKILNQAVLEITESEKENKEPAFEEKFEKAAEQMEGEKEEGKKEFPFKKEKKEESKEEECCEDKKKEKEEECCEESINENAYLVSLIGSGIIGGTGALAMRKKLLESKN